MIQAGFSPRPFVRSVKPRLSAPWQLPLRAADGPPGTPATAGVVKPAQAGHRSRLRRMTPHDSALNGPGSVLHTTVVTVASREIYANSFASDRALASI